ncbi:MAG: hypothetical protein GWP04_05420 [Gammaproteobacteria bacterium]|nr:hypothetical protein [Gammaproteobacteria bacterium]
MEIVLLRHGESTGNASGLIQGRASSPLSERGLAQARVVARHLAQGEPFDLIVSSDMERAVQTISALGLPFERDAAWREMDLGAWDGVPIAEVAKRFPEEMAALRRGEAVPIGGTGETFPEFTARVGGAIDRLVERMEGTGRVLVSAHGGVVDRAVAIAIGRPDAVAFLGRVANTSLTTISVRPSGMRVDHYNDTTHLGPVSGWAAERLAAGDTVVALVRHGRTAANDSGIWQGHTDGGIDEEGRRQATRLAGWYGTFETLYSSSLGRALETAALLRADGAPVVVPSLMELGMGEWEGHRVEEIKVGWPDIWRTIYEEGKDVPRGGDGETWSGMVARVSEAIGGIARAHQGRLIGVVSHGAAIRGFCSSLIGLDHEDRRRLIAPGNTSVSHVVFGADGPVLADYNIGPLQDS